MVTLRHPHGGVHSVQGLWLRRNPRDNGVFGRTFVKIMVRVNNNKGGYKTMNLAMLSILHSFIVLLTVLTLAHGAIVKSDVVMAFTFEGGDDKLGQVATGVLKDISGNGHNGEFRKSPKWGEGVWGAGLEVGPAGEGVHGGWNAVTVPHADDMDLQEFTIAAWVRVEELIGHCCGMIVSKENWSADGDSKLFDVDARAGHRWIHDKKPV